MAPVATPDAARFLTAISSSLVGAPPIPEVMRVGEVARMLRLDRKTVYDAIAREELPARRVGRRIVISRAALLAWLDGKRR